MKNRFQLFGFICLLGLVLASCTPDANEDPNPNDPRQKFLGTWLVQESGKSKLTYQVNITENPNNSTEVLISNFYNFGIKPYAVITSGTITLPVQSFSSQGIEVNGSGEYSTNKIQWIYYVNDGADLDTIISVYTK
jgi:hypothetical protein